MEELTLGQLTYKLQELCHEGYTNYPVKLILINRHDSVQDFSVTSIVGAGNDGTYEQIVLKGYVE